MTYIYHQEQEATGVYRLWFVGQDRAGVLKTAEPVTVETDDPAAWLEANQSQVLDWLDDGQATIAKTAGYLKQLDDNEATAWREIRDERDERLAASDWTQVAPQYNEGQRDAWEVARQKLRDLPTQYVSPYAVVWPVEPNATELKQLALAEDRPASVDDAIDWSEL